MSTMLRIAGIVKESIVDGPGIRMVVFTQGCKHHCEGCHNPETHDFAGGYLADIDEILKEIRRNSLLDGVTLSGGEPFEQAEGCGELALKVHQLGLTVMTYTGYTLEQIMKNADRDAGWKKLLENSDILVDGKFEIGRKSLLLVFRGSENQRVIDVKQTLLKKEPVLIDFDKK